MRKVASTALPLIICSQLLATSLWFSANGVAESLMAEWKVSVGDVGLLTVAVQIGFISGTLFLALTSIADRFQASVVFAVSSIIGALSNLAFAYVADGLMSGAALRYMTGFCLAGIYPLGMKLVFSWAPKSAGLYLGWLVGMLTLGTALPHLIRTATPYYPWQATVSVASLLAAGAAVAVYWVGDGPFRSQCTTGKPKFGAVFAAFRYPHFRAATAGYFGHMWELYAFWTLVPFLLAEALRSTQWSNPTYISFLSFIVIASGCIGCILGGKLALRAGSRVVALTCLAASGAIALIFPMYSWPAPLALAALLVWGFLVIPDSPQFSTLAANATPPEILGSALALQNSIGFSISCLSILLTTSTVTLLGVSVTWLLVPGPLLGILLTMKFRSSLNERTSAV